MSEQNFVETHGGANVLSQGTGAIQEPTLNTSALKDAAKALLNKGSQPNPAPSATPSGQPSLVTTTVPSPVSPVQQIPVSVSDAKPQVSAEEAAARETPEAKVTATDAQGNKQEINIFDIPDEAIVRMKRNGEIITMPAKDAKADMMRGAKFTHEMQQLRAKEAQFETRLQQAGMLEQLVSDDVALASYIFQTKPHIVEELAQHMGYSKAQAAQALATAVQQQHGVQPQSAPFQIQNPAELASLGEVDQLLSHRAQTLEQAVLEQVRKELGGVNTTVEGIVKQQVQSAVQNEIARLRNASEIQSFDVEINKTVDDILTANPALKAVPNINQVLRFEVFKMKPQTPEEMKEAFSHVASGIVEGLNETYNTAKKVAVITKAEMEKQGIEPPVGTQPTFTRPLNYADQRGQVDWKKIKEVARASLG
jgi:hypothetical protein